MLMLPRLCTAVYFDVACQLGNCQIGLDFGYPKNVVRRCRLPKLVCETSFAPTSPSTTKPTFTEPKFVASVNLQVSLEHFGWVIIHPNWTRVCLQCNSIVSSSLLHSSASSHSSRLSSKGHVSSNRCNSANFRSTCASWRLQVDGFECAGLSAVKLTSPAWEFTLRIRIKFWVGMRNVALTLKPGKSSWLCIFAVYG